MKITVIGTGYVGLVTGTIFAELGNDVCCVDINKDKIALLQSGKSPIYEPGLQDLVSHNIHEGRLKFTNDINDYIRDAQIIFIGVNTPSSDDGSVNLDYIRGAATDIGKALAKLPKREQHYRIIVNKSTVPIGTAEFVAKIIRSNYHGPFDVVSNPEFLREGQAVNDCLNPDRIIIGSPSQKATEAMEQLYNPYDCPKFITDVKTAELIKYASNAFLATSISFINSIAELCEAVGSDVAQVAAGMKLDKRIGEKAFLDASAGYAGSCFPKDVKGLIDIGKQNNVKMSMLLAAEEVNGRAYKNIIAKITKMMPKLKGKTIAIWGIAFKPRTDDIRLSPAIDIIRWLLSQKSLVKAYDPIAEDNARQVFPEIGYASSPYEAATKADLVITLTPLDELKAIDLIKIKDLMNKPRLIDARMVSQGNCYGIDRMEKLGFEYSNIGNTR